MDNVGERKEFGRQQRHRFADFVFSFVFLPPLFHASSSSFLLCHG